MQLKPNLSTQLNLSIKHCIKLLLNFVSKHSVFKRPEYFRKELNSTRRMARDFGVDHQLSAFSKNKWSRLPPRRYFLKTTSSFTKYKNLSRKGTLQQDFVLYSFSPVKQITGSELLFGSSVFLSGSNMRFSTQKLYN